MSSRRSRRTVLAVVGSDSKGEHEARALAKSLDSIGVEIVYLGRVACAGQLATIVAEEKVDSIELCWGQSARVIWLRDLLRELTDAGRRDVSILVHRVE